MARITTYNQYHLGDNLIHLHFLRALAKKYPEHAFTHYVHECHLPQLVDAVVDLPAIELQRIESLPEPIRPGYNDPGYNVWKNAGGFWQHHADRNRFAEFHLQWFAHLAHEMSLKTPFSKLTDLLFDYPAIKDDCGLGGVDFLIVNSQPCSGQFRAYDALDCMDGLIKDLASRHSVITTRPVDNLPCTLDYKLTITQIGNLSLRLPHLVMVSTGPSWPTFNIWNQGTVKTRLLLIDCGEDLATLCPGTVQTPTLAGAREILKAKGLL